MSNNSPFESVTILSAVDDDIVPIVEAIEADVDEKAQTVAEKQAVVDQIDNEVSSLKVAVVSSS